MRIAVIGATGALGQDLMRIFGADAVGFTHEALEVTDAEATAAALASAAPDWVINTSAFHRVDECEREPARAFAVNAVGAGNVAHAAAEIGAGVMFFSTDYVFSGAGRSRGNPYTETAIPDPLNVYGISKLAGEQLVCLRNPRHIIVRTSALYGWSISRKGWTFPEVMMRKARAGEPLRVVADQITSPTFTLDLARKAAELIERDAAGIFHVANAGECSWFELAQCVLELAGLQADLQPTFTSGTANTIRRPGYSALGSMRLPEIGVSHLRPWQDALSEYVARYQPA